MEVNKEELLIHILQGASNTDGMYPMRQTAGIARPVETGNDDLPSCFHAVHGLKLFTTLGCKN